MDLLDKDSVSVSVEVVKVREAFSPRGKVVSIAVVPLLPGDVPDRGRINGILPAVLLAEANGLLLGIEEEGSPAHILQCVCSGGPSHQLVLPLGGRVKGNAPLGGQG